MLLDTEQALHVLMLRDLVAEAQMIMPPFAFAYVSGGAGGDWTMLGKLAYFNRRVICPRSLAGQESVNTKTRLLGADISYPVITAPLSNQGSVRARLADPVVKGTAQAGTNFVESSVSQMSLDNIFIASSDPKWLQIYLPASRPFAVEMLPRAKVAG